MDQRSCVDYANLKESLVEMWVPARGVLTISNLWRKNQVRLIDHMSKTDGIAFEINCFLQFFKEIIETLTHDSAKQMIFKTNVESYFDIQPPFQLREAKLTGSWSEGLFLYDTGPPDMDFMCVLKNITFRKKDQECGCLLLKEDTAFVYAFIANRDKQNIWSEFLDDAHSQTGIFRLSPRKLKEKLQKNYQETGNMFQHIFAKEQLEEVTHGAAVTIRKPKPALSLFDIWAELSANEAKGQQKDDVFRFMESKQLSERLHDILTYKLVPSSDLVLSIFCEAWPSCAQEWITRDRLWPDVQTVQKIAKGGFHIVPKSSPDGDFRLSFSFAETMLIQTLSELQHKVMRAFKKIVKYYQSTWSQTIEDIISSYHLKTIAFWHFEKTSQASWTEDTLVHHLVSLVEKLAEAMRLQDLPMYFMPKVNLIKNRDDPEVALDLMENILRISLDFHALSKAVKSFDLIQLVNK